MDDNELLRYSRHVLLPELGTTALPGFMARRALAGALALADWWAGAPPTGAALEDLRGREVVAVAGLARPERFFAMLREQGLSIVERAVGDHDDFARLPWPISASDVIVTEKDAVKLAGLAADRQPRLGGTARLRTRSGVARPCSRCCRLPAPTRSPRRRHRPMRMETRLLELARLSALQGAAAALAPPQHERQELVCSADGLAFPVRDGIPVMLEGEARPLGHEDRTDRAPAAPPERRGLHRSDSGPARLDAPAEEGRWPRSAACR